MMKILTNHPGELSLQTVETAIKNKQEIKRSPHVGNVNAQELATILGIASLGGTVQVELVDTIQGNDKYARPHLIAAAEGKSVPLISRKKSNGRVVGACLLSSDTILAIKKSAIDVTVHEGQSLTELHSRSLQDVLPSTVRTELSSEFFALIESVVVASALDYAREHIDRPLRRVGLDGKIQIHNGQIAPEDIFGTGEKPQTGILPPLELMMAIEMALKAADTPGCDSQVVHVAGPDMIVYTKDDAIMNHTKDIAAKMCSDLGLPENTIIEYTVPDMMQLLKHAAFVQAVSPHITSQYDLLQEKK